MRPGAYSGVVHRLDDGRITFGDEPSSTEAPRHKAMAGTLWYSDASIRASDLAKLLVPGDDAFGPRPGDIRGITIRVGERSYTVHTSDSWGVRESTAEATNTRISELRTLTASAGLQVKASAAATSMMAYMRDWNGQDFDHPATRQLPSRWRAMARAAFHGGPIVVARGGAPHAVQVDMTRAYLSALYSRVPVLGTNPGGRTGGYHEEYEPRWDKVRKFDGFVDATVTVNCDPSSIPPLPIARNHGIIYPNGRFRGCWVISQVRDAEQYGVTVEHVHQAAIARDTRPLFAEVGEFFNKLPDRLSKICYQRFWGKWGSPGGWKGSVKTAPDQGEKLANDLWWHSETTGIFDTTASPTYRPDIAAFIAAHNHREMMRLVHKDLTPGSVVALHVDAAWTTDIATAAQVCSRGRGVGSWREKRRGPLRFWAAGCYDHAGDLAASGYDKRRDGPLSRERLSEWIQTQDPAQKRILLQRVWAGGRGPSVDVDATSEAPYVDGDTAIPVTDGPDLYNPIWRGDWAIRDHVEPTPRFATAQPAPPPEEEDEEQLEAEAAK